MTERLHSAFSTRSALTALSFCLAVASAPFFLAKDASAADPKAAANFVQADANADGALTPGEFKTFMDLNAANGIGRAQAVRDRNLYSQAFGRLDTNRDGMLSTTEIQSASR